MHHLGSGRYVHHRIPGSDFHEKDACGPVTSSLTATGSSAGSSHAVVPGTRVWPRVDGVVEYSSPRGAVISTVLKAA